jgi:hypothetical protein
MRGCGWWTAILCVAALLVAGCGSRRGGGAGDPSGSAPPGADPGGGAGGAGAGDAGGGSGGDPPALVDRDGDGIVDERDAFPDDPARFAAFSALPLDGLSNLFSAPLAVNGAGEIVGVSDTGGGAVNGAYWSLAATSAAPALPLRPLPGNAHSVAYAISPAGVAVGESELGDSSVAVAWTSPAATPVELPLGGLLPPAVAHAIDGRGAAGQATTPSGQRMAVLWSRLDAGALPLGTLPGGDSSAAYALAGEWVVGESTDRDGRTRGAVWLLLEGGVAGFPQPLEPLPGHVASVALGVDARGRIVGESEAGSGETHAVAWVIDAHGAPGAPIDLGPGTASAISSSGHVAGARGLAPALWGAPDLAVADALLEDPETLGVAHALNEARVVVGRVGDRGFVALPR